MDAWAVVLTGTDVPGAVVVEMGVEVLMTVVAVVVVPTAVGVPVTELDDAEGIVIVKEVTGFVQPDVIKPFRTSAPRIAAPALMINSRRVMPLFLSNLLPRKLPRTIEFRKEDAVLSGVLSAKRH